MIHHDNLTHLNIAGFDYVQQIIFKPQNLVKVFMFLSHKNFHCQYTAGPQNFSLSMRGILLYKKK